MKLRTASLTLAVAGALALGIAAGQADALAQAAKASPPPAAPKDNCKTYGSGHCCTPEMTAHLTKDAIFAACGKSDAVYLGEKGTKGECRYYFKVEGEKEDE